jgi:hypothetical protein
MKKVILLSTIVALLLISCGSEPSGQYTYRQPEKADDGLDVGTLEEVSMDQALIESAVDGISGGKFGEVHSLLIYKDGKLVFEEYFPGHDYLWDGPNFHGA